MTMRFNFIVACIFLAGVAQATPAQDVFAGNMADILSRPVTVIDGYVFAVGRAKSSARAGDEIGYSKAALLAYSNLDYLNFQKAEWPEDATKDEQTAAWKLYRQENPFSLTIEGGQRIYWDKPQQENFLMVMVFPKDSVLLTPVHMSVLKQYIDSIRGTTSALDEPVDCSLQINPIRGATIRPISDDSGTNMTEVFDEEMML